jgi:hypothetical protein
VAFGTPFSVTGGFRKAGTSLLERVTGGIFTISNLQIVSDFIEACRNFILDFLHKKRAKNVKTISTHSKSTDLIFRSFKKIFIS